jgi:hypothetical protein
MHKLISMIVAVAAGVTCSAQIGEAQSATLPPVLPPRTEASGAFLIGPPNGDGPVVVWASFELRNLKDIDDEAEIFEFSGVLTLRWHDERQAFDPVAAGTDEKVYQGANEVTQVFAGWFPQVILVNESGLYQKSGVVLRVQPDGNLTLVERVNAAAEADLNLRRYPFDRQRLEAIFEVLGFDNTDVVLQRESEVGSSLDQGVPQWNVAEIGISSRDRGVSYAGRQGVASGFVVSMDVQREPFFMVRLVVLPLALIVMLSWSVFWMDPSSVGDRMNVSFMGILTAVAYQIVVSDLLPRISYGTLMNAFLNLSFLVMSATVMIDLRVCSLDKQGKSEAADRLDRRCRWIFPLTYFGLLLLIGGVAFSFF